ncbi:hypothetical protein CAC02_06115 [Streptococcus gallolyticus]|uniref:HTH lacI-type domain-containing protein n=1 Tax=Streptococcus gallolyticus TaxID=315405 RepID=A0A368UD64_9STRE|nr:LacI family DNA-binding transcriptional regulator [Streptococcus gallolyticus]RCW16904.1 hypothetical protein CAC02_06115 [Streptococcus gallolyticus]
MTIVKSIKDIARMAGVSPSTVSRVLNKNGRYSKETEQRIQKIIEESGFVNNVAAKSLRNSKTHTIGLMVPDISNDFFSKIVLEIETILKEDDYSVFICNSHNDPDLELHYFKDLIAKQVDGIICFSQMTNLPKNFENYHIPVIAIDREPLCNFPVPCVTSNDFDGGYLAGEAFCKANCQEIFVIDYLPDRLIETSFSRRRLDGFKQALFDHQVSLPKKNILHLKNVGNLIFEAEAIVNRLLAQSITLDAIFATNDRIALGVLSALKAHQLTIPDEVKVIGYDNSLYSIISTPTLSTISRHTKELAKSTCLLLIDMIEGRQEMSGQKIIIPTTFIERESSH